MKIPLARNVPVIAAAVGLLLIGSTGGAVADRLITGNHITDHSRAPKHHPPGGLTWWRGLRGPTVARGATGATGATGARGASSWVPLPSGVTVTGRFFDRGLMGSPPSVLVEDVSLPGRAPSAPTTLAFGASDAAAVTTENPDCAGSYTNPTAPAGYVCVYLALANNISSTAVLPWTAAEHRPYAFFIYLTPNAGDYAYYGSWAYTAP